MRIGAVRLAWRAIADDCPDTDHARLVLDGAAACERRIDRLDVVPVGHLVDIPAIGAVAGGDILGKGEIGRAVDRDVVIVVEHDQPAELQMSGK